MLKSRGFEIACVIAMVLAVAVAAAFAAGFTFGLSPASASPPYMSRLFDDGRVHEVDIRIDDWDAFIAAAPEEEYVECDLVIDGELIESVGLRAKGNNSRRLVEEYGLSRYSLKVEVDHFSQGASYYGLDKFSLDAAFQDNSYMKNHLAFDMMEHMSVPTPASSYAWVTVNGEPWGLFLAIEEPEEAFAQRNFGPDYGQLYKPDYKSLEDENHDVHLRYAGDDPALYDNIFRTAKFDPDDADRARLVESLRVLSTGENLGDVVNIDEVLRYFVVQTFVVNMDSYLGRTGHNYFLYEEDGVLAMIPWDYNLAFATYSLGMPDPINDAELYVNYPIDTPAEGEVMFDRPLYHNLMKYGESFDAYHELYAGFLSSYFDSGAFEAKVAETFRMIAPYVERDPTAFCSYEDFELAVDTIEKFCLLRAESVRSQLEGTIPSTIAEQAEHPDARVDASSVWIPDMGEIADLED